MSCDHMKRKYPYSLFIFQWHWFILTIVIGMEVFISMVRTWQRYLRVRLKLSVRSCRLVRNLIENKASTSFPDLNLFPCGFSKDTNVLFRPPLNDSLVLCFQPSSINFSIENPSLEPTPSGRYLCGPSLFIYIVLYGFWEYYCRLRKQRIQH